MATALGNINLFVGNVARATHFYTEVLGLQLDEARSQPPSFALLRGVGDCTLTLQDASATPGGFLERSRSVEIGFAVEDVEAVCARLSAWGVAVSPVQQMGWGTAVDTADEDGHRLTIYRMRD